MVWRRRRPRPCAARRGSRNPHGRDGDVGRSSGCGKTTLLCVIAGLLDKSGGELSVLGEMPTQMGQQERILFRRHNLGFVFQQYNLLPALTAAENVAVPCWLRA